mgnify:CR=1 FL=1
MLALAARKEQIASPPAGSLLYTITKRNPANWANNPLTEAPRLGYSLISNVIGLRAEGTAFAMAFRRLSLVLIVIALVILGGAFGVGRV